MTDSPSDRPPDPSRRPSRGRATIDLRATEVRESTARAETAEAAAEPATEPANRASVEEGAPAAEVLPDPPAAPESAHGGAGTDSPAAAAAEPATEDALLSQAAAEAAAGERTAAPLPGPRRTGFVPLVAASLLGGLVGAGATYVADQSWRRPAPAADTALQDRLARLETQAGALARQDAVRALDQRIGTLSGEVASLSDRARAADEGARAALAQAQEALNRPAPQASAGASAAPDTRAADDLSARLAAVEGQLRERAQANAAAAQSATRSAQSATQSAQSATETARTAAEQAQTATQAAQNLDRRLADLDRRLADLSRQAGERTADAAASLRVALTSRVAESLRDGAPYAPALGALRGAGTEPARLAALEPFAATGAPTAAALRKEFEPLAERIRRETRPPARSVEERFWRMLDKVVTVRPVDEAAADGIPALLARIDEALARGAFEDASTAWDGLPEPARRLSQDFGARLKQRAAAEEAARTLSAEALSGLEASTRSRS